MDYKTKPTTRFELRKLANAFDILADTKDSLYKPVVELLDKIPDIMPFVHYEIVDDNAFEINVPARGYFEPDGNYTIEIKEYVYNGAIQGNGACRGFIMHEIFHPFLYRLGFVPLYERSFKDGELHPYESVEWQVKAITGEYMMNYDQTKDLLKMKSLNNVVFPKLLQKSVKNIKGGDSI